jgi:hypothetical protein
MSTRLDYHTIEPNPHGEGHVAYAHGVYLPGSVLAGRPARIFVRQGPLEELREIFPDANVLEHSSKPWRPEGESLEELSGLPATPPDWFDPLAAGESW